MKEYIEYEL